MNVPVIWLSYHEETPARGYWDQGMLEDIFNGRIWQSVNMPVFRHYEGTPDLFMIDAFKGAIVVVPARHHAAEVERINTYISQIKWCLLIVTGDEEHVFPVTQLNHPRMLVYEMTPGPDSKADRYLPNGYPPQARQLLPNYSHEAHDRPLDCFFAGQVTHARRQECVAELRPIGDSSEEVAALLIETQGFTQGLPHSLYYSNMASAKIVPCPSGPATPDTFRLYEALEAGCLPIVDSRTPKDAEPTGYWSQLFGLDELPFPIVDEWTELPGLMQYHLDVWPSTANKAFAWWQGYKRQLGYQIHDDISHLSGIAIEPKSLRDKVTVIIPTSPIRSHPDTSIIEETIKSVRERLPDSEIIIMFDGVREEQEDRRQDYEEYQRRLLWKCNYEWTNVLPLRFEEHQHQASMTRQALKLVRTPTILFVEHDTPLCEEIPFESLVSAIVAGEADLIRLHHEAHIIDEHKHMMLDQAPQELHGAPLMRTAQWSQRPHVASTDFYRKILDEHFSPDARTMIEDKMHGVAYEAFMRRGKAGWQDYKLWIYAPDGDMKRSYHLDGRDDEPKYEMKF